MRAKNRWSAGELVPLADRLRYMFVVRVILVAVIALGSTFAPGLVGTLPAHASEILGAWAGLSVVAELTWRAWRGRGLPLFGATLILDGAALVWLSEVGSVTNVRYLLFVHLVSVVLLGSYRTGLKMAMWYTLLLFTIFFASQNHASGMPPLSSGTVARWDLGQLAVFAGTLWAVALATAMFSSVNERELRRRRFDLEALARLATVLEGAADRKTVAEILLERLADAFPLGRLLLVTPGGLPSVLARHGMDQPGASPVRLVPESALMAAQTDHRTLLLSGFDPEVDPWMSQILGTSGNFLVVPLHAEGGCVAVLVAEHVVRGGSRVERRLVSIIERFAAHGALALRNAGLVEQLESMANTDGLTHVGNRRTFETSLEKEMARSMRTGEPVGLIMLDLDNFKTLNDTHGHQVGDDILREVALALRASSRDFDVIARYGGEEFAVILPGCGPEDALRRAERLRRLVSETSSTVPVTVSLGVASFPAGASTAHELVKAADDALYRAKRGGRDQVRQAEAGEPVYGTVKADVTGSLGP